MTIVLESFPHGGNALQPCQNKTSESFKTGIARQGELVLGFEIAQSRRTFEHNSNFSFQDRLLGWRNVELVLNFADQLFKNVFDGDHTGG